MNNIEKAVTHSRKRLNNGYPITLIGHLLLYLIEHPILNESIYNSLKSLWVCPDGYNYKTKWNGNRGIVRMLQEPTSTNTNPWVESHQRNIGSIVKCNVDGSITLTEKWHDILFNIWVEIIDIV